jgi:hypothetical protein
VYLHAALIGQARLRSYNFQESELFVFSEINFRIPGQLRPRQLIGIVLVIAGFCVMASHIVRQIHETPESSTWSARPATPATTVTGNEYTNVR